MTSLHLGCGLDHRPGAVNADLYDLTAADLQADALRLPLADCSIARLEACQLVEHLGQAGTVYALAEWLRALEPGGTLLIETPDRVAACLAAVEPDSPARTLHWLFGLAWPGYAHRTLFDENDLRTAARQAGLIEMQITRIDTSDLVGGSLRLTACKPDDPASDLRARLHHGFVAAGIVDPLRAAPHLAHLETVCDRIVSAVEARPWESSACLATILGATACHDPRVTQAAIQIILAREIVSEVCSRPYLDLARSLVEEAFPARLAACLRQSPALAGTQIMRLQRLSDQASLYLTARLHPHETLLQPSCEWLEGASAQLAPTDREITFFCAETMADLSRRETARGVRAFSRGDLKTARERFCMAIAYDADNPLPIWDLARLDLRAGRRLDALQRYAALLELVPGAADALRGEMDVVTERKPDRLSDLMEPVRPCTNSLQATARQGEKGARA